MQNFSKIIIYTVSEANLSQTLYLSALALGIVLANIYSIWYGKKLGILPVKTLIVVAMGSGLVLATMELLRRVIDLIISDSVPVMNSFLNNMGRSFVFVPLIALVAAQVLKLEHRKVCAVYSFTQPIIWGVASLGCLFAGCCKGYPCRWGIYHYYLDTYLFPTQLINAIALLLIAGCLLLRAKRRSFVPDGREYYIMLLMVGMVRFLTEFLMDNKKLFWGCSSLSFDALMMCLVGGMSLLILSKCKKKDYSM